MDLEIESVPLDDLVPLDEEIDNDFSSTTPDLVDSYNALLKEKSKIQADLDFTQDRLQELERLIRVHPDTGLPIFREFALHCQKILDLYEAQDASPYAAVVLLRLDHGYQRIKNTRDKAKVLLYKTTLRIAEIIGDQLYQSDRIDEFIIFIKRSHSPDTVQAMLKRVVQAISLSHEPPAEDVSFSCHAGVALYPDHGRTRDDLFTSAEIALNRSEELGQELLFYSDELGKRYHRRIKLEKDLRTGIQNGFEDFYMLYQPFVDQNNRIVGCESLIRWNHPELGFIPPPDFIPLAEENGEIKILGLWTLYQALVTLKKWRSIPSGAGLYTSVNLSPEQFKQRDLVDRISGILNSLDLPGSALKLEITEGTIMESPKASVEKLLKLKEMGIRISIDDFGTGYSSLNYLNLLPIDTLKIDKSFIDNIPAQMDNCEIIRAIISMANNLHIETLAEGVEYEEQRDFLFSEGCLYIQGYYYSKPVSSDDFANYLKNGALLPLNN